MTFAPPPPEGPSLADRAAGRSTADLVATRAAEAQTLMDAGAAVMVRHGTSRRATVAEIVRESGLSNQAFYRHFAGKDDLVAALIDAGARRLVSYVHHLMEGHDDPVDQIRTWIRGVLAQATDPKVAQPTRAITWNRSMLAVDQETAARSAESLVWALLVDPLRALGSGRPESDAYFIGRAVFGVMTDALWAPDPPSTSELAFVEEICIAGVTTLAAESPPVDRGP
jgi:AcrR family transcriptional regulator